MKLKYKNQHHEVVREETIKQAYTPEDINVFFSFGNELDTINKHVKVISNVKNPEKIYTLRKGVKEKHLVACGISKITAKKYLKQRHFSRKTTNFTIWKKINHLLEPIAIEKHVALEDGRIVKYKDYESVMRNNYYRFILKKGSIDKLGISREKLSTQLGIPTRRLYELEKGYKFFTNEHPLYSYLSKKNMMDLAVFMDDDMHKRWIEWLKSIDKY